MNRKQKTHTDNNNKGIKKAKYTRIFINELKIGERVNNFELKIVKKLNGQIDI